MFYFILGKGEIQSRHSKSDIVQTISFDHRSNQFSTFFAHFKLKTAEKSVSTSFRVPAAPESWSKCTTYANVREKNALKKPLVEPVKIGEQKEMFGFIFSEFE